MTLEMLAVVAALCSPVTTTELTASAGAGAIAHGSLDPLPPPTAPPMPAPETLTIEPLPEED